MANKKTVALDDISYRQIIEAISNGFTYQADGKEKKFRPNPQLETILKLEAVLGLRISDIKNLKFENIDWKNNIINYTQQKTKETNELPLTNEIGESLIDYINNERPKCESKYIFITLKPPYTKISNNYNLYDVVNKIIFNSKIKDKQKRGIHCFRHSLATNLLKTKTSLDIITPILGHVSKNTTTQYINLNNKSLSNLSLEDIYE